MAFPADSYYTYTPDSPTGTVTDFSVPFAIYESWGTEEESFFDSLSDTSDVTKIHAYKSDGTTRLAIDIFDYDLTTAGSRYIIGRYLWSGARTSTGSYPARLGDGGTATAASDTYGQYNAYDDDVEGYYPDGGGNDRTGNQLHLTASGGVVAGDRAGLFGKATGYDGSTQYYSADTPITAEPFTFICQAKTDSTPRNDISMNISNSMLGDQQLTMGFDAVEKAFVATYGGGFHPTQGLTGTSNTWYSLAGVFSSTISRALYVDDGSGTTGTDNVTNTGLDTFGIGASQDSTKLFFDGLISQSWLISSAKSSDFIAYEYTATSDIETFQGAGTWVSGSTGEDITPTLQSLTLSLYSPTVTNGQNITPDLITAVITLNTPNITVPGINPDKQSLTINLYSPAVTNGQTVSPEIINAITELYGPIVGERITPDIIQAHVTIYSPVFEQGGITETILLTLQADEALNLTLQSAEVIDVR